MDDELKHHNWAAAAGTAGTLAGTLITTMLAAGSVDIATHWISVIGGIGTAAAAFAVAYSAAIRALKK